MILIDTHVVVWLAFEPVRISTRAKAAVDRSREQGDGVAISAITLLELAVLTAKQRIHIDISLEQLLQDVERQFVVLPITASACVLVLSLPAAYPRDPADRLIGATALSKGLPLITADRAIQQSKAVHTIW